MHMLIINPNNSLPRVGDEVGSLLPRVGDEVGSLLPRVGDG